MRIKSLYISAFGGIKDLKLDFQNGFNIVYGENENGKSTIMAFIKMMFYGSERGSSQLSKNIRKKAAPWDGSPMAGSIDFEHSGKSYRLEREFRSSNSTDRVTLCDSSLGERQSVSGDIGVKFLGLSPAAFERSVFIGQFGFPENDSAAEGEINSKLSNIALTGDESVSFETVNSRLEKAKLALMSKSGRAGEYDKNLKLCAELKARTEKALSLSADCANKKEKITLLQRETEHIIKTAEELKAKIDSQQDIRNREKLKEYLELKKALDSLNQNLKLSDGSVIDEMFLRKLQFCISKVQSAADKSAAKQSEKDKLQKSIDAGLNPPKDANPETAKALKEEIEKKESEKEQKTNNAYALKASLAECEKYPQSKKTGKGLLALAAGIICLVLSVIFEVINLKPLFIAFAVIGCLLIAFCPVYLIIMKNAGAKILKTADELRAQIYRLETETEKLTNEIFERKIKLEAINTALNSSAAIIANQRELLRETDIELQGLKASEQTEREALFELFAKYKKSESIEEIVDSLEEISQIAAKQKEIKQQLNFISKDLGGISYEDAAKKLDEMGEDVTAPDTDFDALKEKYQGLVSEISDNKSRITALATEIKINASNAENPEELKSQLKALVQKTAAQKEFCDTADIAMQTLLESFGEIRKSYGSVLEKKAGEIFARLTGEKYGSMSISKAFDINVTETHAFGSRDIAYLSSGTADQAYLSLRLALSQLICDGGEFLPVMLDDSLTQYDDKRMKTAMEYLSEYSEDTQVIMFTCHNSVCDTAKALGAEYIPLK